jgi:hypothetical protein
MNQQLAQTLIMTTNRATQNALDTLLTGYLIDSITNYCGRHIEELPTLKLSDDFFTKTASMDDDAVQSHLITEFSKLDTGFFHFNKHKRLAKKLAKYICQTRNACKKNGNFKFNPGSKFFWQKSDLHSTCESTNAELNYISKAMTSPHFITKEKTDKNKKTTEPTVLDHLNNTKPSLNSKKPTLTISSLNTESLTKAMRDELLERFIYKLSEMKTKGRASTNVDKKINAAIALLKNPINSPTELRIAKLRNALEEIAAAINNNYAWFQSFKKEDKRKLNDINEMLLRFSRDSFICTLTEKLADHPVSRIGCVIQAESKEGLADALGKLIEQKKMLVNPESHSGQSDEQQSSSNSSSTQTIQATLSNLRTNTLFRIKKTFTPSYSPVASSESNQTSQKPKVKNRSTTNADHKTKNTSSALPFFKKVFSRRWLGTKKNTMPKT